MKRKWLTIICTVMMVIGLCACGGTKELSEAFDEAAVKASAEELIGFINEDDVEGFCAVPMSADMQDAMTVESVGQIFDQYLGKKGDFVEYNSIAVVGATDKTFGECAIVVVSAEYENLTVQYTISYDTDLNLIGFFLK